ncbi:MAG: Multimeric flavodoxin WrbA-like [Deltaproteobacteria bacterium]|jgi:multimeric flavodoxin WrbA|nr:Multimeric flavodoxin WrbA-like [Deltaproteobacteria bacterium]MBP2687411.1 Multimeric flavodoxin WrbA-like [Deltaproteobacteria bacterium]MBP2688986.1 Multimeric flavodoxin WrbA-like [Deltaproteobacteria bacterium]
MIKLLGIIGSPRRLGNCELMVKEIATAVPGSPKLRMVRLVEKDIRPCKACYRCLTGDCPHPDDYSGVLRAIMEADAVVVAAPAYLRGTHSSLQRFLDRGLQAYRHVDALYGKPAVAVATAGVEDGEGSALMGVENFIRQLGMSLKGRAVVRATFPGDAIVFEEGRSTAHRLAAALVSPDDYVPEGISCPECKGTYFEFRGMNGMYCLSCGATGILSVDGGKVCPMIRPPAHSWRKKEEMAAHGKWLIGQREEFLRQRYRLKDAVKPYLGGEFI